MPLTPREYLFREVWDSINQKMVTDDDLRRFAAWVVRDGQRSISEPFVESAEALNRLLELGASARDIGLVWRWAAYETAFRTLFLLDESGLRDVQEICCLFEFLLTADPSGRQGFPPPLHSTDEPNVA